MDIKAKLMAAKDEIDLSYEKLRDRYVAAGGDKGTATVERWMLGRNQPTVTDYEILARVINDRLRELGKEPMVPMLSLSFSFAAWDAAASAAGTDGASLVAA